MRLKMRNISVKCPAKINLTLEVVNKREDGYHNIKSIMQLISLYDYIDITAENSYEKEIILSGNNPEIPYDNRNLVYKAAELFMETTGLSLSLRIHITKNIPIAAGLAGGSTDAAGTLYGLNEIFGRPFPSKELHQLCAQLGSDLNVCLEGGCLLAQGRGEKIEKLPDISMPVTLIKPKTLGISAREAYTKYSLLNYKPHFNNTEKMITALENGNDIQNYLYNDLERAVFNDYPELWSIKSKFPNSIMSGSGSTYFVLQDLGNLTLDGFDVISGLSFISSGVEENQLSLSAGS